MRAILIATFITVAASLAWASDCTGLKQWNSDTTYKKGDLVWTSAGGETRKWECTADSCGKNVFPDTTAGLKVWTGRGYCDKKP